MCFLRLALSIAGLFAAISLASVANAQEDEEAPDYLHDGFYVGAHVSDGIENFQNAGGLAISDSLGLGGYVGYRFLERYALEFQYEWFHEFSAPSFSGNAHIFTTNVRYFVPWKRLHPYLLVGMGLMQSSRDGSFGTLVSGATGNFTGRLGGGLDVYITENWVLEASATYVLPTGNLNQMQFTSLGLGFQYRFMPLEY